MAVVPVQTIQGRWPWVCPEWADRNLSSEYFASNVVHAIQAKHSYDTQVLTPSLELTPAVELAAVAVGEEVSTALIVGQVELTPQRPVTVGALLPGPECFEAWVRRWLGDLRCLRWGD